ncbi:MAG: putative DNA-binding domain-containing protein [Chromatiales bacterium]|nr:putative DNA-binding domain-containing protein [Chromatiales bacterium]
MPHTHKADQMPRFMQRQYEFALRIRDPENAPAPDDVAPTRMAAYAELFYNNINECLSNAFPVLHKLHDDEQWHTLVRDYFSRHRATTPLFHEMPREFLLYLQQEREEHESDHPFMWELAHYEWIELELLTSEDVLPKTLSDGDLLIDRPVLSPLTRILSYHYAVHQIGPDNIPQQPGETLTHLLVYRDSQDKVGFIELNPVTARLLLLIGEQPQLCGQELLEQIAAELNHPNPQTVIEGGRAILDDLHSRDIILGTRP